MERKPLKICLVSFLVHEAFFIPLSHIRDIIAEISPGSHAIITVSPELSGKMIFDPANDDVIIYKTLTRPLFRIINYIILNFSISWNMLLRSKDTDAYVFFTETGLSLPMTVAKVRNKQIIWLLPSSMKKMTEHNHDFPDLMLIHLQSLAYVIADKIVLYSPNLIKEWNVRQYSDKILIAHEHFVDTDTFTLTVSLSDRPLTIGFIGRLSEEKGILNFVQALPEVLNDRRDLDVLIGGHGPLEETIAGFLKDENLTGRVTCTGWLSHEDLPEYLNKLRLIVLPSYTEGLPNIVLEAMMCGTPVLATKVGAIPDIIKDRETGFILENNSPLCVAESILKALGDPNLENIALHAKKMVEKDFTFDSTVNQWKRILGGT
jgi:glycosyltransferase involved in cell wall biosynthesis